MLDEAVYRKLVEELRQQAEVESVLYKFRNTPGRQWDCNVSACAVDVMRMSGAKTYYDSPMGVDMSGIVRDEYEHLGWYGFLGILKRYETEMEQ